MASVQCLSPGPVELRTAAVAQMPHVLLVVDGFPKILGGGERIVLRLASLLPQYGFRASILTFSMHPESSFQPEDAPCPLYLLPLQRTYDLRALKGALHLRRFLREQKVQIVQTFFESSDLWAGMITRGLSRAKLVWSRRDMGILREKKHSAAYRLFRHLPHAVFAVSDEVRRHVIETDGIAACKVQTVHNGLELDCMQEAPSRDPNLTRPTILTIGNIRRVKGHDLLVQAAPPVVERFPEVCFQIAGEVLEEDFYDELLAAIRSAGLENRFEFLGNVTELQSCMRRADLFVLPSRSEGFSNALIEAMANALPVVATQVGGNAEAVVSGVTGWIVPPEDAQALGEAMLRILSSAPGARRMGEAGRARVRTEFTADAMMQKVVRSYRELLSV